MYDELVKRLRICPDYNDGCVNCQHEHDLGCRTTTMREAADAIEELKTYKDCFDNIVSMGGWWLVGQDKKLYLMDIPMNWPPKGTKTVKLFPLPEPPKEE